MKAMFYHTMDSKTSLYALDLSVLACRNDSLVPGEACAKEFGCVLLDCSGVRVRKLLAICSSDSQHCCNVRPRASDDLKSDSTLS